jgi:hypothetical protein
MSSLYPQLEPDAEPEAPVVIASAPEDRAYAATLQKFTLSCGLCELPLAGLQTKVACGHEMHVQCLAETAHKKSVALPSIAGVQFCSHCREAFAQGFDAASAPTFDPQIGEAFCANQLRDEHTKTYPKLNLDAAFQTTMTYDRMLMLLGESRSTFESLQKAASSAKFLAPLLAYIGHGVDEEAEQQRQLDERVLYGQEFIEACAKRNITINDILANHGHIADLWNFGLQSMEDLRSIGFSAPTHFSYRHVLPIHVLVNKFGASYEKDMKEQMTNEQLLACGLRKYELPLLGLRADALVARNFTPQQLASFEHIRLADWIRYGGLQISHAIRMRMSGSFIYKAWPDEMVPGSLAYKLYADVRTANGKTPRPPVVLRKKQR